MTGTTAHILQDLYDSEINFAIATFWDCGFEIRLGDPLNGFAAIGNADNFAEAVEWLRVLAIQNYPESMFAKVHRQPTDLIEARNDLSLPS
ncbi:hypothetical protein [Bradyrhizobium centrosematis]|uniref:hypothetical protein n=1 Tax=Bradyrhizobium centrosematis TaxID=1300039 RepID=UPI00388EAA44